MTETYEVPFWPGVIGRRIRADDGWVHYVDLGVPGTACSADAPVLILLHKLGGWVADWRHVAETLAGRYRVVAVDLPGHGGSTMDESGPWAHPPSMSAARVLGLLDTLGVGRSHIMGNSLGGIVGLHMAVTAPTRVETLTLVGVSLTERHTLEQTLDTDRAVRHRFGPGWEPRPLGPAAAARAATGDPGILEEQDLSRACAGRWVRPSERGVGLTGVEHLLPEVHVPTLLINGVRAGYRRYEDTARALLRDVRIATVDEAGSFPHQERPAAVAALWEMFVHPSGDNDD